MASRRAATQDWRLKGRSRVISEVTGQGGLGHLKGTLEAFERVSEPMTGVEQALFGVIESPAEPSSPS